MNHFLDIGANVGQTFDDFLLPRPEFDGWTIWCFEPSPRHVPALMEKAASVRDRYAAVHVCAYGLTGTGGEAVFYLKDDPRGDSFSKRLASDHETANIADLRALTDSITGWIGRNIAPGDSVTVKIDAEGAEYGILDALIHAQERGYAIRANLREVFVEWHTTDTHDESHRPELERRAERAGIKLSRWQF